MAETQETQQDMATAQEAGGGKKRDRTLIEFPYADLSRSHELAHALMQAGGKIWVEQTQLAVVMDMSVGGGTFRGRLSAARMFGLIETEAGKVRLSDLGLLALDESTERGAKVDAFLKVPLYKAMYDAFNGFALPPAAAVERQMIAMGVPPKQAERARQAFASSAQTAGYIANNGRFSKPMINPAPARDEPEDINRGGSGGGGGSDGGEGTGNGGGGNPPIAEKALEYKLVDLMSEALDKPDVMTAIITVITFLKARESKQSKTGTDQQ